MSPLNTVIVKSLHVFLCLSLTLTLNYQDSPHEQQFSCKSALLNFSVKCL